MKQKLLFVLVITALVLTACGGAVATQPPAETEAPVATEPEPAATEAPATEAPTEPPAAAGIAIVTFVQQPTTLKPSICDPVVLNHYHAVLAQELMVV